MDKQKFLEAQSQSWEGYQTALSEIKSGGKTSHWMWYIFPQAAGLGFSYMSQMYAIESLDEAREYLNDPVLGARLKEISQAVLDNDGSIEHIMGSDTDAAKLRSCMTLFSLADPDEEIFQRVLVKFFGGRLDNKTLEILKSKI